MLYITGGGSNNNFLNQLVSCVMGIPVYAGSGECTTLGNLLLQAYGNEEIQSHRELREIVLVSSKITEFQPDGDECWKAEYERYLQNVDEKPQVKA